MTCRWTPKAWWDPSCYVGPRLTTGFCCLMTLSFWPFIVSFLMPVTSRGLPPISIACCDMSTSFLSGLLFNLYKLASSLDNMDVWEGEPEETDKTRPYSCRNEGSTRSSYLRVFQWDFCPVTRQVHGISVKDQEDTRTGVLMGDGEANAINPNADIKDTMAPSLSTRYTTHN